MKRFNHEDFGLVLKLKSGKTEENTIFRIGKNKATALHAKIKFMKKKNLASQINLIDLATDSRRQIIRNRNKIVVK